MSARETLVIIGHSHTACLAGASKISDRSADIRVVSLKDKLKGGNIANFSAHDEFYKAALSEIKTAVGWERPQSVCLSIQGNRHNNLSMLEHPNPVCIGTASGVVPKQTDENRIFIPSAVLEDVFSAHLSVEFMNSLYSLFPSSQHLYLIPPPPIGDMDHLWKNPGVFKDMLHRGFSPSDLRLAMYAAQIRATRRAAHTAGATPVEVDPSTKTDDGFLAKEFCNDDPTHGNVRYGTVMLNRILEMVDTA